MIPESPVTLNRNTQGKLMRKQDYLEVKEVAMGEGMTAAHLHIRRKAAAASKA